MQQPPAIMQASENLIEKGSKPAARLGRRIKSSGTLFTVHFVFVFPERFSRAFVPLCLHDGDAICRETDPRFKEKHECICHTDHCISHTVSMTSAERGTFCRAESRTCNIHRRARGRCSVTPISTRREDELQHGSPKNRSLHRIFRCARRLPRLPGASHALIKAHDAARGTERNQG